MFTWGGKLIHSFGAHGERWRHGSHARVNTFDEVVLIDVVSAGGWDDGFLTYGFTLL